jgi:PEP-CTERM motif
MRISGLFAAAIALSALTPIAPAHAITLSPGDLMYTDFFLWPDWRQILAKYDCTPELQFYMWNAPPSPTPVITPPPTFDSAVTGPPGGEVNPPDSPGDEPPPTGPVNPIDSGSDPTGPAGPIWTPGTPIGDPPCATPVPEPSTWAMLLLGFAGLGYAGLRRNKGAILDKRWRAAA